MKDIGFFSRDYWERRYATGGGSGRGSYGRLAEFKADFLNSFVREHSIGKVVDFGCGDGNVASLLDFPNYVGLDISETAVRRCAERFRNDGGKSFFLYLPERINAEIAELTLSLDVVYHLIEDGVFELYMKDLFASSSRYVIIYSTNMIRATSLPYIKHRKFTEWIEHNLPVWKLTGRVRNKYPRETEADFYIFERVGANG